MLGWTSRLPPVAWSCPSPVLVGSFVLWREKLIRQRHCPRGSSSRLTDRKGTTTVVLVVEQLELVILGEEIVRCRTLLASGGGVSRRKTTSRSSIRPSWLSLVLHSALFRQGTTVSFPAVPGMDEAQATYELISSSFSNPCLIVASGTTIPKKLCSNSHLSLWNASHCHIRQLSSELVSILFSNPCPIVPSGKTLPRNSVPIPILLC